MTRYRQYVVKSDLDDSIVFDDATVRYEARLRRITPMRAAQQLAAENTDILMDETLYPQEVAG